jgi:hypothetical protein
MKVYHKLTGLALLGTFAFGGGVLSGTVALVDTMGVTFGDLDVINTVDNGELDPLTFSISVENNRTTGYSVTAISTNNGKLVNTTSGGDPGTDGNNIRYTVSCNDLDSGGVSYAVGASNLDLHSSNASDLLTPNLTVATPSTSTTCTIGIPSDETYGELFAGTYSDTLTISF